MRRASRCSWAASRSVRTRRWPARSRPSTTPGCGYLADVRASDPGAATTAAPAPWDGVYAASESVERFALVHHIEEFARHAGHADIIREQLDGAAAAPLLMAAEGRPGNEFVQPWAAPAR